MSPLDAWPLLAGDASIFGEAITILSDYFTVGWMRIIAACVLLSALAAGALSPLVVNNRMAFFSDAMAHATLAGAALGMIFGIDVTLAMAAWAIMLAALLVKLKRSGGVELDTGLGVIMSGALALGTILYKVGVDGYSGFHYLLFGKIALMQMADLWKSLAACALALSMSLIGMNHFARLGVSREMAQGEGTRVALLELLLFCVLAFVVSVLVSPIGVLMINAYLIVPAATSRMLARSHRGMYWGSLCVASVSALFGLVLSHVQEWPPGPSMVLMLIACFALAGLARKLLRS